MGLADATSVRTTLSFSRMVVCNDLFEEFRCQEFSEDLGRSARRTNARYDALQAEVAGLKGPCGLARDAVALHEGARITAAAEHARATDEVALGGVVQGVPLCAVWREF